MLFSIKINDIVKNINSRTNCALFVDDFLIWYRPKNMNHIERKLQICLDKLHKWTTENGLKFSKEKTKCLHFYNQWKLHLDPVLKLNNTEIPVIDQYKYLGVTFDCKLSFILHIRYLRIKCNKIIQLHRTIAHTDWGGSKETLRLYCSLIRSKLDYSCFIYGAARKTYLKEINTIHHQGLRLALGVYSTSPVESLYAEANEPSLKLRWEKLALQNYLKLSSCPLNPALSNTFQPQFTEQFLQKETAIKPFSLQIKKIIQENHIDTAHIHKTTISSTPHWIINQPKVILNLNNYPKFKTNPIIYKSKILNIKNNHPDYLYVYTDGVKNENKDHKKWKRITNIDSIYSAKIIAVNLALDLITTTNHNKFIIFTDSLSVLTALKDKNVTDPLTTQVLNRVYHLSRYKEIIFCWIPSHLGYREMTGLTQK